MTETTTPETGERDEFELATNFRLSVKDWGIVAGCVVVIVGLVLLLWGPIEKAPFGPGFRMPSSLKDDYWLFARWSAHALDEHPAVVLGDSVPWGQFVDVEHTLGHYLTTLNGRGASFANLAVGGVHPVALEGLLRHHGSSIRSTKALLYWNLVWMRNETVDLKQEEEYANINHPRLLPQFSMQHACYRADFETRCVRWLDQRSPVRRLTNHLRMNYYANTDLQSWVIENPYRFPLSPVTLDVAAPFAANPHEKEIRRARRDDPDDARHPLVWTRRLVEGKGYRPKDHPWVSPEDSRQWSAFLGVVELLADRGNDVFVLVGPLNEHMLSTDANREVYRGIRRAAVDALRQRGVPHYFVPELPRGLFADLSHPLEEGYRLIAQGVLADNAFARWLGVAAREDRAGRDL